MIKKIFLLILILSSFFLTGCINSVKLSEQAIVQAISLDLEDDKIKIGLQLFSPSKSGEGKVGASVDNAKILEATGDTITQAMQNISLLQGKKIFTGHNKVIIIGEDLAKNNLSQTLEFFSSTSFARKNVSIATCKGKAIDIIKAKINQGMLPAETLQKIIVNASEIGYADNILLYEFESAMQNNHDSAILPIFDVKKEEKKDDKEQIESLSNIYISGSGIITDEGLVHVMSMSQTRGILWITDKVDLTTVISSTDVYSLCTINISNSKTKITPHVEQDSIIFDINIACKGTLGELHLRDGKNATTDDIKGIQKAIEKAIKDECNNAFYSAVIENKADIFNFGNMVWYENVEIWKTLKDNWSETATDIEINVKVDVDVDSIGLKFKNH